MSKNEHISQELRSPELVFDGDNLPDDLKWVMAHFGLPKSDPFVVLLAWHWHRVQSSRDVLENARVALESSLDAKLKAFELVAAQNESLKDEVQRLRALLSQSPEHLAEEWRTKWEMSLKQSMAEAKSLSESLNTLSKEAKGAFRTIRFHQMLAVFFSGLAAGSLFNIWIQYLFSSQS